MGFMLTHLDLWQQHLSDFARKKNWNMLLILIVPKALP
jgi:hypothetical protein